MSLLSDIKFAQVTARKNRHTQAVNTLTTLIGEAEMVGKNAGNRDVTDQEVVTVIKKFIKGVDEMISLVKHPEANEQLQIEKRLLEQWLPKQLTSEQILEIITDISNKLNAHTLREMGKIMKVLKERFDGQYDGAVASTLIKSILT